MIYFDFQRCLRAIVGAAVIGYILFVVGAPHWMCFVGAFVFGIFVP